MCGYLSSSEQGGHQQWHPSGAQHTTKGTQGKLHVRQAPPRAAPPTEGPEPPKQPTKRNGGAPRRHGAPERMNDRYTCGHLASTTSGHHRWHPTGAQHATDESQAKLYTGQAPSTAHLTTQQHTWKREGPARQDHLPRKTCKGTAKAGHKTQASKARESKAQRAPCGQLHTRNGSEEQTHNTACTCNLYSHACNHQQDILSTKMVRLLAATAASLRHKPKTRRHAGPLTHTPPPTCAAPTRYTRTAYTVMLAGPVC
jgi:hypothetical protein